MRDFSTAKLRLLYQRWKQMTSHGGRVPEWDNFDTFCCWAEEAGFECGNTILRIDDGLPWSPDNCCLDYKSEFVTRWNKTVNRIRAYYGMPLFK